jgi:hypothetical protein
VGPDVSATIRTLNGDFADVLAVLAEPDAALAALLTALLALLLELLEPQALTTSAGATASDANSAARRQPLFEPCNAPPQYDLEHPSNTAATPTGSLQDHSTHRMFGKLYPIRSGDARGTGSP